MGTRGPAEALGCHGRVVGGQECLVAAHLDDSFFSGQGSTKVGSWGRPDSCLAGWWEANTPIGGGVLVVELDMGPWRDPKESPSGCSGGCIS